MNRHFYLAMASALLLALGCKNLAKVEVTVVDERTQLENQVRGEYEQLEDDLVQIASVRGVDETGKVKTPPPVSKGKQRALAAMQNREFNRDDIERFKSENLVGENNDGLLTIFEDALKKKEKKEQDFLRFVVEQENRDRLVLMRRVIEVSPNLEEKDLPAVKKVMAARNRDSARPGEKYQTPDGKWMVKAAPPE